MFPPRAVEGETAVFHAHVSKADRQIGSDARAGLPEWPNAWRILPPFRLVESARRDCPVEHPCRDLQPRAAEVFAPAFAAPEALPFTPASRPSLHERSGSARP